jgi:hypothetical protein
VDLRFAVQLASFVLLVSGALWVRQDALKRHMSPHWGTGDSLLLFGIYQTVPPVFVLERAWSAYAGCRNGNRST